MGAPAVISRIPVSFWRFGLIGVGGLCVDMAVLYAVMWTLALAPVSAKVVSFLAAATFTWWMNRQYTFGSSGKSLFHEWASFLSTNAFGGTVNFAVYTAMVTQLVPYAWMPALATAMGSLSGLFFNYMASRLIVFNQRQQKTTQAESVKSKQTLYYVGFLITLLVVSTLSYGVALWLGMGTAGQEMQIHLWPNTWALAKELTGP